jgi:hypothetical protein
MSSSNLETSFSVSSVNELFKTDFKSYQQAVYNEDILLWSQLEKKPYTGKEQDFPKPFDYSGGVSSGSLPKKKAAGYQKIKFSNVRMYAAADVEREAIALSMSDKGAFVKLMEEPMKKIRESATWNAERAIHGTSDGKLGTIASGGVTDNGAGNYTLVLSSPVIANFEEGMFVNIETGNTDLFEIEEVDPDTSSITVQRESGALQIPAQTDEIFMQQSEDNDPFGLYDMVSKTTGLAYNVNTDLRKWHSSRLNLSSKSLTPQTFTQFLLRHEKRVGKKKGFNMALFGYTQMEKMMNQLEDSKMYDTIKLSPKDKLYAHVSFDAVVIHTPNAGSIVAVADRFVPDSDVWFLNKDECAIYEAPKSGFVTEDTGSPLLRGQEEDKFDIRWAWYGQAYFPPIALGQIYGASVS